MPLVFSVFSPVCFTFCLKEPHILRVLSFRTEREAHELPEPEIVEVVIPVGACAAGGLRAPEKPQRERSPQRCIVASLALLQLFNALHINLYHLEVHCNSSREGRQSGFFGNHLFVLRRMVSVSVLIFSGLRNLCAGGWSRRGHDRDRLVRRTSENL